MKSKSIFLLVSHFWLIFSLFSLYARYKREVKRLTITGGGLGGIDDDNSQPSSQEEHLACYVPAQGPDEATTSQARNLCGMYC